MPRSGTTLCEQILSSHSRVDGAGEFSYLAETSNINKIISPTDDELNKFEETVNSKKDLLQTREKYLDYLKSTAKMMFNIFVIRCLIILF